MSDGRTVAHDVYMSVLVSCAKALFFMFILLFTL